MKNIIAASILLFALPTFAIEDTPENRKAEANRYISVMPAEALFKDAADGMARNMPPEERAGFKRLMTQYVDLKKLEEAMLASMIKNFTAEELAAMADFYAKPVAQSAMKKIGLYMSDIFPVIEAEMMRASGEYQKAIALENQEKPDPEPEE